MGFLYCVCLIPIAFPSIQCCNNALVLRTNSNNSVNNSVIVKVLKTSHQLQLKFIDSTKVHTHAV